MREGLDELLGERVHAAVPLAGADPERDPEAEPLRLAKEALADAEGTRLLLL